MLESVFDGRSFYYYNGVKGQKNYMSFEDMQRIHNDLVYWKMEDGTLSASPLSMWDTPDSILDYEQVKLVKQSTLQYHKRKKTLIPQKQRVKFLCL